MKRGLALGGLGACRRRLGRQGLHHGRRGASSCEELLVGRLYRQTIMLAGLIIRSKQQQGLEMDLVSRQLCTMNSSLVWPVITEPLPSARVQI